MLVEKEVIRPGTYFYREQSTGLPRKLTVTSDLTKYWHDEGNKMLSAGLTIPVPMEHDFEAHPLTPADRLKSNAGWVKEYRLKGDRLYAALDVQDNDIARKLPTTIRWTSPWINSFTDGNGQQWRNVISHLALTTRPRIVNQEPFGSIAAALSMATETSVNLAANIADGFCLSPAGRVVRTKEDKRVRPLYPVAFSLFSGASFAAGDMPFGKKDKSKSSDDGDDDDDSDFDDVEDMDGSEVEPPDESTPSDVTMEELLVDLLGALGVTVEHTDGSDFKRSLYNAVMTKVHELTDKGQSAAAGGDPKNRTNPPGSPPNNPKMGQQGAKPNPLIQQEQQPMYMSLEEINKLPDPMRGVALAMYTENQKLRADLDSSKKVTDSLQAAKLREADTARQARVALLGKLSPKVKADLDAMLALPSMALSMGDGGTVVDPMAQTLAVLEKGLSDMPRLLTTDVSALSIQRQPTDADMLSEEKIEQLADGLARAMGAPPQAKAS